MAEHGSESGMSGGRLTRTRITTRAAMVLERIWPLILPLLVVVSLFLTVSWFGLFRLMPDTPRLALAACFALAALAALYPLRFFRMPTAREVDRRIERANALLHSPVSVQTDRLSGKGGLFAEALWREHRRRMAARLDDLGSDLPRPHVPERDPWGLRALAALLLVTAFAFSFGPFGGSPDDAFRAHAGRDVLPPRIDAWVTPPAYTGKPPIFLTSDANQNTAVFTVPTGSEVALRVAGGTGEETLAYTDAAGNSREIAPKAPADAAQPVGAGATRQFAGKLEADGVLSLKSGASALNSWNFAVIPDKPPAVRFSGEPKRALNGTLELNYEVEDDYGVASAKAEFELADPQAPDARPLYEAPEMSLALPRRGAKGPAARTTRDLTEHAWAGERVKVTLKAVDAAKQEASSETKTIVMPQRPFSNPLARAVVEQRRILALDANRKARVLELLDAITLRPEDTIPELSHYLALMSARTRLKVASTDDQLRDVADYFWQIALGIEDGDLSAAEKRLAQAQEALRQALENGASDEEIDRLMKELREAMNEFLREFAERAQQNPNLADQMPQPGQELRQSDLDRMLDQIENLAKSGSRDKAQELLSQLQDMMNNLQAGRQQRRGQSGQENSEMRQRMDELGNIMRRQQEMMNETFRMDQMQRGQRQRGQGQQGEQQEGQQGQPGEQGQGGMSPEEFAEALKQLQEGQGQLRKDLEALMKGLEGLGIQPGEGFGEAGEAMGEAEGALGQGEGERATGEQGRALEALRRGAQDMMNQMMQAMQGEDGGGQEGGRQQSSDRDPLGRPRATTGPDFGDSVEVPDEIDVQRARRILDAIRERLGNALSPQLEREYLERLLDMK
ncbi:TIGR02302 family protein [Mesorhizobium sp. L-8-3]|uniref:TIGR02302 family protein n=1 Tax=Mesorhizobium sp. L-8-3 TaxID=2744522 RepID=UPI001928CDC1|nr:TIGR02302 family protein [Mesorhizobium sp. L-8-3]BCH22659.1 TIGR02302 family protein [Mesorhizobium sp. L-8-3]